MDSQHTDMDVFVYCTVISNRIRLTQNQELKHFSDMVNLEHANIHQLNSFKANTPSTKHLVNALYDWGFSRKFIMEYLNINASTVSYHLSHKPEMAWYSPVLRDIRLYREHLLENDVTIY